MQCQRAMAGSGFKDLQRWRQVVFCGWSDVDVEEGDDEIGIGRIDLLKTTLAACDPDFWMV